MTRSAELYTRLAAELARAAGVEVERYRSSTSGHARIVKGRPVIETPEPRGPVSFGTFCHEIGHHVLGHLGLPRKARWVEETEAWEFALKAVERLAPQAYDRVYLDATQCLAYAYAKAYRRGVAPATIEEMYPAWWSECLPLMVGRHSLMRYV